ncbi:MAG: MMPL family transporter, partial [Gammaproteobacteria bacterium]
MRYAWLTLFIVTIITAFILAYTVRHLSIDTDTADMIDPKLPHRRAHQAYREAFPTLTNDIVVFTEAANASAAEEVADKLTAAIRETPRIAHEVIQPGGGEFFATHGLLFLSLDELWALDERLNAAEPFIGALAHDPSLRGLFTTLGRGLETNLDHDEQAILIRMLDRVSAAVESLQAGQVASIRWRDELFVQSPPDSGRHRSFIMIDPVLSASSVQPALAAVDAVRAIAHDLESAYPEVRIRITGDAVMDSEELVTVANDARFTTVLSFLCVAIVLMIGLRTASLLGAVLLTLVCGLTWTAGLATYFIGALNIISVCFAVLFIGRGVDFGIQYSMRYLEESDRGRLREAALVAAGREAGGALALAAVGAAISFLAFVPTSYRG